MLSYDEAIERALDAFRSAHPTETLPAWFENGAFREEALTQDGKLRLRYYAQPASPLGPNQRWVETGRGRVIHEVDPVSGETSALVSRDVPKNMTLFCVTVDPVSGDTTIIEDVDISAISNHEIDTL